MEINSNYYIIEKNEVFANGAGAPGTSGIHLYSANLQEDTGDYNIIRDNVCHNNKDLNSFDGNGIQLDQGCDHNQVYYNVCFSNDGAGISIYNSSDNQIYNNTLYNNMVDQGRSHPIKAEIYLAATVNEYHVKNINLFNNIIVATRTNVSAISVDYLSANNNPSIVNNLIYHTRKGFLCSWKNTKITNINTWNTLKGGAGKDLYGTPSFVSSNPIKVQDFALKQISIGLNKAIPSGQIKDILDNVVPRGTGPDLGAIESY